MMDQENLATDAASVRSGSGTLSLLREELGATLEMHLARGHDGTWIRWLESGSGTPLVVSSPVGLPFELWVPLVRRLQTQYRIIFMQRRGLWGSAIPADPAQLGVDAHARDLARVIDERGTHDFLALAFCSGALPLMRCFDFTAHRPRRLCLMSGRFCVGDPVPAQALYDYVGDDPVRRNDLIKLMAEYAPEAVRDDLERELGKPGQLLAQLHAVEDSRRSDGAYPLPPDMRVTFVYGECDDELIKQSTLEYVRQGKEQPWNLIEIPNGSHFYLHEDPTNTARVILDAFACAE